MKQRKRTIEGYLCCSGVLKPIAVPLKSQFGNHCYKQSINDKLYISSVSRGPTTDCSKAQTKENSGTETVSSPSKTTLNPRDGASAVKTENTRRRKTHLLKFQDDDLILQKALKRRKLANNSVVVRLNGVNLKIRRSTRLLRSTSSDQHGSVYVDFPTYKNGSQSTPGQESSARYAFTKEISDEHFKWAQAILVYFCLKF